MSEVGSGIATIWCDGGIKLGLNGNNLLLKMTQNKFMQPPPNYNSCCYGLLNVCKDNRTKFVAGRLRAVPSTEKINC